MKTIIYDFWAPWCYPCRAFLPTFEEWARKYGDRATFVKVNVADEENAALAARHKVNRIPTVIVLHDDAEVARVVGIPKEEFIAHVLDGLSRTRQAKGG